MSLWFNLHYSRGQAWAHGSTQEAWSAMSWTDTYRLTGDPGQYPAVTLDYDLNYNRTNYAFDGRSMTNANALLPALEQLAQKDMLPEEMLADSLYGSDSNCEAALQEHQVTVIAPVMPGNRLSNNRQNAFFCLLGLGGLICPMLHEYL